MPRSGAELELAQRIESWQAAQMRVPSSWALVVAGVSCAATVRAQPDPSSPHIESGALGVPASLSVGPAQSSDIAPGPPLELLALPWTLPQPSMLPPLQPTPAPPLRLRLELPAVLGVTPFAQTTFRANGSATELGARLALESIHAGTRFAVMRDDRGLWLHNASHLRFVAPRYDLGLESMNDYALMTAPVVVRSTLLASAGMRATPDAPTVRVTTSLFGDTGRLLSRISAFGTF